MKGLVLADQKASTALLELGVAGLQVGLILQHGFNIEHVAVLGFPPADKTVTELRAGGIAHGLLQHLLELGFAGFFFHQRPTYCLQFDNHVAEYRARMEVTPVGLKVQDLGYRWGSCGKGHMLYFHWKTILLPARIAEYVVVHELAHLHEPHHTPSFGYA